MPYVGSGTLASALAMDKTMAKKVFAADGIPLARGFEVRRADFASDPRGHRATASRSSCPSS